MNCPKCGFEQALEGAECQKWGLIFSEYLKMMPDRLRCRCWAAIPAVHHRMDFTTGNSSLRKSAGSNTTMHSPVLRTHWVVY
jgi:hypothetical protein